jgi:hypothetical protein
MARLLIEQYAGGPYLFHVLLRHDTREAGLNREETRRLHDEITGENLSYDEILDIARAIRGYPRIIMPMSDSSQLDGLLVALVDQECWSVTGTGAAGSDIKLELGGRVSRRVALTNVRLSEEQRIYEGTFDVFVQCPWRIEIAGAAIYASGDDHSAGGPMAAALQRLVGKAVIAGQTTSSPGDLVLSFSDGVVLKVFCDRVVNADDADNYSLRRGDTIVSVRAGLTVAVEQRTLAASKHGSGSGQA